MPNKAKNKKNRKGPRLTDVPVSDLRKYTHTTVSCRIPKITQECTLRSCKNDVLTAGITNSAGGYIFSLSNAQIGSAIFDRYRIDAVRFSIAPRNNAIGVQTGLTDLYFVIDYDDASSLASQTAAETYSTVIKLAPGESSSRTFAPRIAVAAYNGAFTGFLNQGPQWIDCASNTVQHYGIKTFIPGTGVIGQTVFQTWDIQIEYFIKFISTI